MIVALEAVVAPVTVMMWARWGLKWKKTKGKRNPALCAT